MPLTKYQRLRIQRNRAAALRRKAQYARMRRMYGPINYYKPRRVSAMNVARYTPQGRRYYKY